MSSERRVLNDVLGLKLTPALLALGFERETKDVKWRRGPLEVRVVTDSKATDPHRGGAFTLEFEKSSDGRFEAKLAGRTRVDQLLDADQRRRFLELRNAIASRLQRPSNEYLASIPESVRPEYLKAFDTVEELEPRPWMRFKHEEDVEEWCDLLGGMMFDLVSRAETLDAHELLLGQNLTW